MNRLNVGDMRAVELSLPAETVQKLQVRADEAGVALTAYLEKLASRDANEGPDVLAAAILRLTGRSPEQIAADRERVLQATPPPRPLPAGKTLFEVVEGTWPGDETDDEIREMLERLS